MKKILVCISSFLFVGCGLFSKIENRRSTEEDKLKDIDVALNIESDTKNTQIKVLEFFDFNDGNYEDSFKIIERITAEFDKNILIERHHFPKTEASYRIAEIAECAGDQGKFDAFRLNFFQNYSVDLSYENLIQISNELGLDFNELELCTNSHVHATKIAEDKIFAEKLGVTETPYFIVGKDYKFSKKVPEKTLRKLLQKLMRK
jgi:predicted DsbA family dithiol-disulfide isomerase